MEQTVITSRKNPLIQRARKLIASRKERQDAGLFACDGTKLLSEAVTYWEGLDTVFLTEDVQIDLPERVTVIRVSPDIMAYISPMETPQGAFFLCRLPQEQPFDAKRGMLLLDGIQDPGNLGTILRTADALDIPVALLEGCAEPYSHKVVCASMGAVFRSIPVRTTWESAKQALQAAKIPVGVTALSDRAEDIRRTDVGAMAVVIGSEGQGVRSQILKEANRELIIPMNPRCESLNAAVAATIVMWQMVR